MIFILLTETGYLEYILHKPLKFLVHLGLTPKVKLEWQSLGGGMANYFWLKNLKITFHPKEQDIPWYFTADTVQSGIKYTNFQNLLTKDSVVPLKLSFKEATLTQIVADQSTLPPPYPTPLQLLNSPYVIQNLTLPALNRRFEYKELNVEQLQYIHPYTQKVIGTYNGNLLFNVPDQGSHVHQFELTAEILKKYLSIQFKGDSEHFQLWGEWDKNPLSLPVQFLATLNKKLLYLDVKWRDWLNLNGMGSFQDRLTGTISGTVTKGNWNGDLLGTESVPYPLSLFPRLKDALIQCFIKGIYRSEWKQGLFFINSHLQFSSETIRAVMHFKSYKEVDFSLNWTDHMQVKGKYLFDSQHLKLDGQFSDLPASIFLFLASEKPDIDLNAVVKGSLKLSGPLKNLSFKATIEAGKGNYNQFKFQSIILSGEGTGRLFTLNHNCKIVQDNGILPVNGYIDLKQDNIFRNLQVQLVNALDFHNLTFKSSQDGMTIDRKIFKNVELEVKGSNPTQDNQDQASIGIRIGKKIKF